MLGFPIHAPVPQRPLRGKVPVAARDFWVQSELPTAFYDPVQTGSDGWMNQSFVDHFLGPLVPDQAQSTPLERGVIKNGFPPFDSSKRRIGR